MRLIAKRSGRPYYVRLFALGVVLTLLLLPEPTFAQQTTLGFPIVITVDTGGGGGGGQDGGN